MAIRMKYADYNNEVNINVADMIDNLGSSVFRWSNLPLDSIPPSEIFEQMLMHRGVMTAFDTNIGLQVLPCTFTRLNQWGYQAEGSAIPLSVGGEVPISLNPNSKALPIVLYDQPGHRSILNAIDWYVEALGKIRQAIDSCTRWLKVPVIFQVTEEQAETVSNLVNSIEQGRPAIAIHKGSIVIGDTILTPTSVTPAVLQSLHDSYDRIKGMLFEELGVPDYNSSKQAQQTSTEIMLPMLAVALKTMNRLYMRRDWADRVNLAYGTNISVECLSLGLIKQSIFSSTGYNINFDDLNKNGIPDELEVKNDGQ